MTGITDPKEEYFKDGTWGWDGAGWRKLPMLFGYSDVLGERIVDLTAAAGTDVQYSSVVPPGEVWIVTSLAAANAITDPAQLHLGVVVGGVECRAESHYLPGANVTVSVQGWWVLEEDDKAFAEFRGCVAGDDLYFWVVGFKMKIAE